MVELVSVMRVGCVIMGTHPWLYNMSVYRFMEFCEDKSLWLYHQPHNKILYQFLSSQMFSLMAHGMR